jgi:hypothetical protein
MAGAVIVVAGRPERRVRYRISASVIVTSAASPKTTRASGAHERTWPY